MTTDSNDEMKPVRRDTTLAPHVDAALTAYARLTGKSISSCLAMAAERGLLELADDMRRARAFCGQK